MTVDFTQAQEIKKIAHQEDIPAVDTIKIAGVCAKFPVSEVG